MKISRAFALPLVCAAVTASLASSAVAAPAPADRDGALLKWHGKERTVQLPAGPEAIPGAPRSFRKFARQQLRKSWIHDLGHRPACKKSPTMLVRSLRTDGFAIGGFGTYAQPGCDTGGGYAAFWAIRNGLVETGHRHPGGRRPATSWRSSASRPSSASTSATTASTSCRTATPESPAL